MADQEREPLGTRVERLALLNFRCVKSMSLDFRDARTTVLYGGNGCGKSAILDGLAILLSQFTARVLNPRGRGRQLAQLDVRRGQSACALAAITAIVGRAASWQSAFRPTAIGAQARQTLPSGLGAIPVRLPGRRPEGGHRVAWRVAGVYTHLGNAAERVCEALGSGRAAPLFAHYGTNRAVLDIPMRIRQKHEFAQAEAWDGALEPGTASSFRLFFEWFRAQQEVERDIPLGGSARPDPQLQAVRSALERILPGYRDFRVRFKPLRMVCVKEGVELRIDQLSDGEKCLIALVGDIARRLAIANPAAEDPLHGEGIVLIDEVDLHLHPAWQRKVVGWLSGTFSGCQFILTTHSPQVLASVRPEDLVYRLVPDEEHGIRAEEMHLYGRDTNTILEEAMGVARRPPEVATRVREMFRAIDDGDIAGARAARLMLASEIGDDDFELLRADVLLRRLERAQ